MSKRVPAAFQKGLQNRECQELKSCGYPLKRDGSAPEASTCSGRSSSTTSWDQPPGAMTPPHAGGCAECCQSCAALRALPLGLASNEGWSKGPGELHATTLSKLAVSSPGAGASAGEVAKSPPRAPRDQEEQRPLDEVGNPVLVDCPGGQGWCQGIHLATDPERARTLPLAKVPCSRTWRRDRSAGTGCAQGLCTASVAGSGPS